MQHVQSINRQQLQSFSLDQLIAANNPVSILDAFVSQLDLKKFQLPNCFSKSVQLLRGEYKPTKLPTPICETSSNTFLFCNLYMLNQALNNFK
jgi:hypothetical protein